MKGRRKGKDEGEEEVEEGMLRRNRGKLRGGNRRRKVEEELGRGR